jgi:hypothetical protein
VRHLRTTRREAIMMASSFFAGGKVMFITFSCG